MAGHRRTAGPRSADGTVRPTSAAGRGDRIRAKMLDRYAAAVDEAQRLAVAVDYARAAAVPARRTDPVRTELALGDATRAVLAVGDALIAQHAHDRRRRNS